MLVILSLHIGHLSPILLEHSPQTHMWPHGTQAYFLTLVRQTLHCLSTSSVKTHGLIDQSVNTRDWLFSDKNMYVFRPESTIQWALLLQKLNPFSCNSCNCQPILCSEKK